jgi:hypothetical protein
MAIAGGRRMRSTRQWSRIALIAAGLVTSAADLSSIQRAPNAPAGAHCGVEMRNVALHLADGIVLDVRTLDGEFVSHSRTEPPIFDDAASYTLRLRAANVSMDARSLTNMLRLGLSARPSPIKDVTVTIGAGGLHATGKLQKGVPVPFSMTASISATADGLLRLHATKLKAVGVPVKGLLDLLGLKMENLMKMPPGSGMRADGDDLLLDTAALMPPPRTEGRLKTVTIVGDRMVMGMTGPATPPARPAALPLPAARNYIYFFGGSIRFGKLTMSDADMELIDASPRDPFDFFPARYEAQLVAGYSRNTRRKGLQVFMPDYSHVASNGGILKPPRLP